MYSKKRGRGAPKINKSVDTYLYTVDTYLLSHAQKCDTYTYNIHHTKIRTVNNALRREIYLQQ